jgi:hypothetical protein
VSHCFDSIRAVAIVALCIRIDGDPGEPRRMIARYEGDGDELLVVDEGGV